MRPTYQSRHHKHLTQREIEIIHLIVDEQSTREIAESLYLSTETIKTYRHKIMTKLDVKNVAGIVREAFLSGIVQINTSGIIHISDRLTVAI